MATSENHFLTMAKRLGHSVEDLKAGKEVRSTIKVNNIAELKALLHDGAPPEVFARRCSDILTAFPIAADLDNGGVQGLLHRVEAHVYGDAPLSDNDQMRIKSAFPLHLAAFSVDTKTLDPNQEWNLNEIKEDPAIVNIGSLIMQPGSSIIIRNKALNFTVGTITRNSDPKFPGPGYDLAIFGATGDTGATGATGPKGSTGGVGKFGNCSSVGIAGDAGQTGVPGRIGITGDAGHTGGAGKPSLATQIIISKGITGNAGHFMLFTKSGTGGVGGFGGQGGDGGQGGTGGDGASCDCTGSGAGNGGVGGTAGRGGTGGVGGNGTDGSIIFVTVPQGQGNKIIQVPTRPMPPGGGGTGGNPGTPGGGGTGGAGGKHNGNGGRGGTGAGNGKGVNGAAGTVPGKPGPIKITEV